jgi:hypothetical protein
VAKDAAIAISKNNNTNRVTAVVMYQFKKTFVWTYHLTAYN